MFTSLTFFSPSVDNEEIDVIRKWAESGSTLEVCPDSTDCNRYRRRFILTIEDCRDRNTHGKWRSRLPHDSLMLGRWASKQRAVFNTIFARAKWSKRLAYIARTRLEINWILEEVSIVANAKCSVCGAIQWSHTGDRRSYWFWPAKIDKEALDDAMYKAFDLMIMVFLLLSIDVMLTVQCLIVSIDR